MKLSFIVPVLNEETTIKACLDSIVNELDKEDELIVVDNGSTDQTLTFIKQYENVKLLDSTGLTIAGSRNLGAREATGSVFVFIDADCILCEGYRRSLVETLADQKIHATGSRYGLPASPCWIERAWFSQQISEPAIVQCLDGGNLIIRKEAFAHISGFDDNLITDEDEDICLRLIENGYCIFEDQSVRVVHLGNPKTIYQFYRKITWHATSGVKVFNKGHIDKPALMSLLFMIMVFFAIAMFPIHMSSLLLVLLIPCITAVYRVSQYKNYKYIFQLTVLYTVYFLARSTAMLKYLFRLSQSQRS